MCMKIKLTIILLFFSSIGFSQAQAWWRVQSVDLLSGNVICWELEDPVGTSTIADAAGNYTGSVDNDNNNLIFRSSAVMLYGIAVVGQGDGFFNYSIPGDVSTTVSVWLNGKSRNETDYDFVWLRSTDGLAVRWAGVPWAVTVSKVYIRNFTSYYDTGIFIKQTWTHLVLTRSSTGYKLYVDGVLEFTYAVTLSTLTNGFYSGGYKWFYEIEDATYDQFSIWNGRELKEIDIEYLYNLGNGRVYTSWF